MGGQKLGPTKRADRLGYNYTGLPITYVIVLKIDGNITTYSNIHVLKQ